MHTQIIIARKDLGMSDGDLAIQVSNASMAFLTSEMIQLGALTADFKLAYTWKPDGQPAKFSKPEVNKLAKYARDNNQRSFYYTIDENGHAVFSPRTYHYEVTLKYDVGFWHEWMEGSLAKILLQVNSRDELEELIKNATNIGFVEGEDFFPIMDPSIAETTPKEGDESTLTCVGFRPMDDELIGVIRYRYNIW